MEMISLIGKKLTVSARKTTRSFLNTVPVLVAVLLLSGLFNALTLPSGLVDVFERDASFGPLLASVVGSIAVGHPITSYVLGGELLAKGVGLVSVTALVVSWVTVGVVQLPVESAHLGRHFAIVRNLLAFISALAIAYLTVFTVVSFSL